MTNRPWRDIPASVADSPSSAYIHIPFCRRRCYYCDFPISVVGDRPPLQRSQGISASLTGHGSGAIAQYIHTLCQEIQATPIFEPLSRHSPQLEALKIQPAILKTVFFGGGTPSLLGVEQLATILHTLDHQFGIQSGAECSMEMDPGTFSLEQIQGYATLGINRVSLGTQSFDDDILEACGRVHRVADIHRAIDQIHQVGITNWSLDLISGLPHLTMAKWQRSLEAAIALHPTHISVYDLTLEPNTAFGKWYKPGETPLPTDDATAAMYRRAQQVLTAAGYHHYEVSNYAKSGYECQHNQVYWQNQSYYGFGLGAASYINHYRFSRPRTRPTYADWVQTWMASPDYGSQTNCEPTPTSEQLLETLMLGLRLADGICLDALEERYGEAIVESILSILRPYEQRGWVQISAPIESDTIEEPSQAPIRSIRLTDPEGFLFSNIVLSTLFEKLDSRQAPRVLR